MSRLIGAFIAFLVNRVACAEVPQLLVQTPGKPVLAYFESKNEFFEGLTQWAHSALVFVLNFLTPQMNYLGGLLPSYELRNPVPATSCISREERRNDAPVHLRAVWLK